MAQLSLLNQSIQWTAWLIALVEVVLGLYIITLNVRHTANRTTGGLLLVLALHSFVVGWMTGGPTPEQSRLPALWLAACAPAIQPALLMSALALFKPEWLRGPGRWIWRLAALAAVLPALATLADVGAGSRLWFTGLPEDFGGGYAPLESFAAGSLSSIIRNLSQVVFPAVTLLCLLYWSIWDRQLSPANRRLARFVLAATGAGVLVTAALGARLAPAAAAILANLIFAAAFGYAGFQQMVSERREQLGSLRLRLTALILVSTIPLLIAVSVFVANRAGTLLEQSNLRSLAEANRKLAGSVDIWMDSNLRALDELTRQPDIASMDAVEQRPVLQAMAEVYPAMYLVSTTDAQGMNIARNDDAPLTDYSDRLWFQQAASGAPLTLQTLIGRTTGQPAVVASMPIRDANGDIAGVAMFAADLDSITQQVKNAFSGQQGLSLVVNEQNQVVAHPDPAFTAELVDYSAFAPVAALRKTGATEVAMPFEDEQGRTWRAHASLMANGWAAVSLQPEADLLADVRLFRRAAYLAVTIASLLLLALSYFTIRQAFQPIVTLTNTAAAISGGDLTRVAPVQTGDELGLLARAFNSMTSQMRDLITTLERRVADRTRDLERRAVQLQVTADVARQAAAIRDLESLLQHTVHLISERFNFYHAGIFLIDDIGKYAVLRAANSEGGQRMLARGHKLEVGQVGIVGYVTGAGQSRIALDVGQDAVFFNNPDLPQTRSEMALPLIAGGRVIGALDVQSTRGGAFTEEDIAILQVLADQIALAIENARLLQESQLALEELQNLYQQQVAAAWRKRLEPYPITYAYDRLGLHPADPATAPSIGTGADPHTLVAPIILRGEKLGALSLRREPTQPPWSAMEAELVKSALAQVALTLDNARLQEENRRRSLSEQTIGQISARAQSALDLETVIKTAVQEIGQVLGGSRVQIRIAEGAAEHKAEDAGRKPGHDDSAPPARPGTNGRSLP